MIGTYCFIASEVLSTKNNTTMKKLIKQKWIVILLFTIGLLHLVIFQRTVNTTTTSERRIPLVTTEFIDNPPTNIVVLGERESGVSFVAKVLQGAFGEVVSTHEHIYRRSSLNPDELDDISSRTNTLWIIVVRSPCEWAEAMIKLSEDSCVKNNIMQNTDIACNIYSERESYDIEWSDWENNVHAQNSAAIVKSKSDEENNYRHIFELRKQKLLIIKQIMELIPRHVKILRINEFELNPNQFVEELVKEYKLTPIREQKPSSTNIKAPLTICMDHKKWIEASEMIDWRLEGYFGYHALDCHMCHGMESYRYQSQHSPSTIYLLGERNSGTTFLSRTLAEAFELPNTMGTDMEKFSFGIPVLLHKHMFRHDLLNHTEIASIKSRTDILWVLMVRSPCSWAEGMFRKPYHLCPPQNPEKCGPSSDPRKAVWLNQNSVAGSSLLKFFTSFPWVDWAESVPFIRSTTNQKDGPEITISKPSQNYTYRNVFALRKHKLEIMRQILEAVPHNIKLVRFSEFERSPEKLIQDISREFNIPVKENYRRQDPSKLTHSTVCLTPEEWEAAEEEIDWHLDGQFGFSPFDCRMCYEYDKSTRLFDRIMESRKVKYILNDGNDGKKSNLQRTKAESSK